MATAKNMSDRRQSIRGIGEADPGETVEVPDRMARYLDGGIWVVLRADRTAKDPVAEKSPGLTTADMRGTEEEKPAAKKKTRRKK
jgi:hypothetical protein